MEVSGLPGRARRAVSTRAPGLMEHLVVLLLVCLSGNPTFMMGANEVLLVLSAYLLTILLVVCRRMVLAPRFILALTGFMIILILQAIDMSFLPIVTILGFVVRLYVAYACMCLVRDFPLAFANVMFWVAILSLCFYIPENLLGLRGIKMSAFFGRFAQEVGNERHLHVVLYTFLRGNDALPYRNAGFFWEPGAFAGFLLMGMIFLTFARDRLTRSAYKWRMAIFCLCLLSTKSTMGYVVFPLALLLHFWSGVRTSTPATRRLMVILIAVVLVGGLVAAFTQLGFIETKIRNQMTAVEKKGSGWRMTRFGSLIFDLEYIQRRPVLGWGLNEKTRYALNPGTDMGKKHGNGLSDFLAKLGFAGLGLLLVFMYMGVYRLTGKNVLKTAMIILMILLILNGEAFLGGSLFLGLMFLAMPGGRSRHWIRFPRVSWPDRISGSVVG